MSRDDQFERIDLLLLARLSTTTRRPPSVARLTQDLFKYVEPHLATREWSAICAQRVATLIERGDLDDRRVPTPAGLERVREAMGVRTLPDNWSKITGALIPASVLQLPGSRWSDISSASKLRARVIRQDCGLRIPETPTLIQAVDARVWQALGLDETGPLTLGKLRRAVLAQALGVSLRPKSIDTQRAGQWLATAALGTATKDIGAIKRALVGRWLGNDALSKASRTGETPGADGPTVEEAPAPVAAKKRSSAKTRATPRPASGPLSLESWAKQLQARAESSPKGRYGDDRIFIIAAWHAVQGDPALAGRSVAKFKERLLEANRAGFVRLHRADLVGAMDKRLVRESETRHLNALYHFIELSARRTS